MKALIVNYYSSPMTGAHAYRWSKIAEYWAKQGWQIDYICSRQRSNDAFKGNDYSAIGVGIPLRNVRVATAGHQVQRSIRDKSVFASINKLIKKAYRAIFWPDGLWYWLPFASWAIFRNGEKEYDAIISYNPTYSAHISVLLCRKFSKRNFVWIADYGDPFSLSESMPPNNFKIYHGLNAIVEQKVISACDSIVFTNESTKRAYEQRYSCEGKAQLIPHLVNLEEFYTDDCGSKGWSINLVYVGGLHRGIREPYLAVKIICHLDELLKQVGIDLKVDFYGPVNDIDVSALGNGVITWHGAIERCHAIKVMKNADVLLNIENINCMMTPSKIVEYIATGRPIVNVVEQDKTELLDMYERGGYCCSVTCLDDVERLVGFVSKIGGNVAKYESVAEFLDEYSLSSVANKYGDLISRQQFSSCEGGMHF